PLRPSFPTRRSSDLSRRGARRRGRVRRASVLYRRRGGANLAGGALSRLPLALRRLVVLERFGGVDVAEGHVIRSEAARLLDPESLLEDRTEQLHLHVAEARQGRDPVVQL